MKSTAHSTCLCLRQWLLTTTIGVLTALLTAMTAHSQFSLNALPAPNVELLRAGRVLEMERLSDGKLMVAGDFIRIANQPRSGIARLNANGTLDLSYVPNVSPGFGLQQLLTDSSGRTYVLNSSSLRRLTSTGLVDTSFPTIGFNQTFARSMALVSDGVIVGGNFAFVGLQDTPRAGLVKIRFDGSVDPNFIVSTTDVTTVISTGADEVLLAGGFSSIGGINRTGVAKLNTLGAGVVLNDWNPSISNAAGAVRITDLLVVGSSVYLTGIFDTVASTARVRLAKLALAPGAALDTAWNIAASGLSNARLFQHNGTLLVSTANLGFYANPPAVAVPGRRLMRAALTGSGTIDTAFAPVFGEDGAAAAVSVVTGDTPARMVVGGSFISTGSSARFALAQLNADGSFDTVSALAEAASIGAVNQVVFDAPNQRTYLTGNFLRADGSALRYCLRLTANGSVDTNWRPQTDRINPPLAIIPGTGVWVVTNTGIARVNEVDGLSVPSWVNSTGSVTSLLAANAAIYATSGTALLRFPLTSNGAIDAGFAPAADGFVNQIRFDGAGNSLVVSGAFSQIGGGNRPRLARINANTGALINSFDPNFSDASGALGVQGFDLDSAGGVWAAGNFDSVNGAPRNSPVRLLLSNGDIDPASASSNSFNNGLKFDSGLFYGQRFTSGGASEILRVPTAGGASDPSWRIASSASVNSIDFSSNQILLGGVFTQIGISPRLALAAVPKTDAVFRDGFE
jgi:hypothetical protein